MNDQLQTTLQKQLQSDWQSNAAVHQIINGYAAYHAVLAIIGGLFLFVLLWLTYRFWTHFKKMPRPGKSGWTFEKKTFFVFGTSLLFVDILLTLIVAANISTALKPVPGFTAGISTMRQSSYNAQLHSSFNDWIVSGDKTPPTIVQERVHDRRLFHTKRVVMSVILLTTFVILSRRLWTALIAQRNAAEGRWTLKQTFMFIGGTMLVMATLLMMIILMANLQSAVVPLVNTLQFG